MECPYQWLGAVNVKGHYFIYLDLGKAGFMSGAGFADIRPEYLINLLFTKRIFQVLEYRQVILPAINQTFSGRAGHLRGYKGKIGEWQYRTRNRNIPTNAFLAQSMVYMSRPRRAILHKIEAL